MTDTDREDALVDYVSQMDENALPARQPEGRTPPTKPDGISFRAPAVPPSRIHRSPALGAPGATRPGRRRWHG